MTQWHLGTVGFSYKEWKGVFYPEGMQSTTYLSHYSRIFNSVEIDSTFYGTPQEETVERWAALVPDDFTFAVKTPRTITHELRLTDPGPMLHFIETMQLMGPKLDVVLIQLPPDFGWGEAAVLDEFLAILPTDMRYAVEFRNVSWEKRETADLLRKHRACWVAADYVIMPKTVHPTTNFLYLRFMGSHGRYKEKNHEQRDPTAELQEWYALIQPHLDQFDHVYGYFNNDYAGYSPKSCNRFKDIVGLETEKPEIPVQGKLFE